jgi:hypothetical protein
MAENKKNTGGSSKLSALLYAVILVEFLVISYITLKSAPTDCPFKIDDSLPVLIENLSNTLTISTPQKVIFYSVDANDGSGTPRTGEVVQTLNLCVPASPDPGFISKIKDLVSITGVKLEKTSSKKAQFPLPDEEIRQLADNAQDYPNDIFTIDKNSVVEKKDPKTMLSYIEIPLTFNIKQTGYYRVDIGANLNRISFEGSGSKEIINIDNSKFCFKYTDNAKIAKDLLLQKFNNLFSSLYIAVIDGTQPSQQIPKTPIEVRIMKGR